MTSPAIKICGIRTPELAREAATAGANFIGMVFHPQSRRYVSIERAKTISVAAKENGAIPVAIFVNHTAKHMQEICSAADIQVVQLQGRHARKQHYLLPENYQRFYVQAVSPAGVIENDIDGGLIYCNPTRDYLLFDNIKAGKGKTFDWTQFNYSGHFPMGLAGGLTPNNVTIAIKKFNPSLVDVSSGVESQPGEKDITLIRDFILNCSPDSLAALAPRAT